MNQREKIINAILDCRTEGITPAEMESYAKKFTDDLVAVLIDDLYQLREELDKKEEGEKPAETISLIKESKQEYKRGFYFFERLTESEAKEFLDERAKISSTNQFLFHTEYPNGFNFLSSALSWTNSNKGYDYWYNIAKRIK